MTSISEERGILIARAIEIGYNAFETGDRNEYFISGRQREGRMVEKPAAGIEECIREGRPDM